ncbi:MAG: hypothetical protein HYX53_03255 [Chloroflexi bacterium]|nr:hypothetical protein [Chloroflexota bacterium]
MPAGGASGDERPADWQEAQQVLFDGIVRNVELRWAEWGAAEITLGELAEAVGAEVVHAQLRDALDMWRTKTLDIYAGIVRIAGPFPLTEPGELHLAAARSHVDWEAVRGPGAQARPASARTWMRPAERAELDELELRLAMELRAGRLAVDVVGLRAPEPDKSAVRRVTEVHEQGGPADQEAEYGDGCEGNDVFILEGR